MNKKQIIAFLKSEIEYYKNKAKMFSQQGVEAVNRAEGLLEALEIIERYLDSTEQHKPDSTSGSDGTAINMNVGTTMSPSNILISEMGLSIRTTNCLKSVDITNLEMFITFVKEECKGRAYRLKRIRNFGVLCLAEVNKKIVEKYNLKF